MAETGSRSGSALAVLGLALALRAAYVLALPPEQDVPGLARKYEAVARHLLAGDGYFLSTGQVVVPYVDRIPGHVTLLAPLLILAGGSATLLVLLHAALGALQAPLALLGAWQVGGRRAGLAAGLLVAAWPPLWKSDAQLVETGVTGVVLAALVLGTLRLRDPAHPRAPLLVAAAATAAFALRPDAMPVPVLAAAALALLLRGRARWWAAAALAPAIVLGAAWTARNGRVADRPFMTVGLGTNLLAAVGESVGERDGALFRDTDVARSEGHDSLYWPDPGRRDAERVKRAVALIREHPLAYARGCARRVAVTLSLYPGRLWPGPTAREDIRRWREEHPGQGRYEGLAAAATAHVTRHPLAALGTFLWAPLLLGLAAAGAWRLRRRRTELAIVLALPFLAVASHVPLHAEPRYMFPYVPALAILAGVALAGRHLRHDGAESPVHPERRASA